MSYTPRPVDNSTLFAVKVNGSLMGMPDPTGCKPKFHMIVSGKSGRDEAGEMHTQYITNKWDYDMEWKNADYEEVYFIMQKIYAEQTSNGQGGQMEFEARVWNSLTNNFQTGKFYVSDFETPIVQWMSEQERPNDGKLMDLTFTMIGV